MSKRIAVCFCLLLPVLFPMSLAAQNVSVREGYDYDGKAVTALLPFIGEGEAASVFNGAVAQAVANLPKYSCRLVTAETVKAAGGEIPPICRQSGNWFQARGTPLPAVCIRAVTKASVTSSCGFGT